LTNNPWIIRNPAANWSASRYKASATLKERDLRGVKKLANLAGNQYTKGVLQYDGDETIPLGNDIWAAPLTTQWGS